MRYGDFMINEEFGKSLISTFNDPVGHGVHLLFNEWWQHASESAKDSYVTMINSDPHFAAFSQGDLYAEPIDFAATSELPIGTLGRTYHDWIVDNNLMTAIVANYKRLHESFEADGTLIGMPVEMKHAILRSYQTHDFQHVVTGYNSSGFGEVALQAFCLAQFPYPYFGMWLSVSTTRMTFTQPRTIVKMMDAISAGWTYGRTTGNIQCEKWETMLDQPLSEIRSRYGLSGMPSLQV